VSAPRALIVGAGSLGTLYGACLARAGLDVQLLARPAHAEAIGAAGEVFVEEGEARWSARLRATADPAAVGPAELVVLLTQCQDGEAALASLRHVAGAVELAVSLQNGGATDGVLADWCGRERVLGGASMVGATLVAPGTVRHTLPGVTYVGELDGTVSPRAERLGGWLERGGLQVLVTDRVRSAEWSKLVNAAASMALTALPRVGLQTALADPLLSRCYAELVREGARVAERAGVQVGDWPGMVPVATLSALPLADGAALLQRRGQAIMAEGKARITSSMLRSVETGRPLEVDAVHGFLVAEAGRLGVDAPMLRLAHALLTAIDAQAREG
jgi:2-dehydropantoate 2-reductase